MLERFWSKVEIKEVHECWEFRGYIGTGGYGQIKVDGKTLDAHRYSAIIHFGLPMIKDKIVCHDCDNRKCVNPYHFTIATQLYNMQDKISKGRENMKTKLNETDVVKIRKLTKKEFGFTDAQIATLFPVTRKAIYDIRNNNTWTKV